MTIMAISSLAIMDALDLLFNFSYRQPDNATVALSNSLFAERFSIRHCFFRVDCQPHLFNQYKHPYPRTQLQKNQQSNPPIPAPRNPLTYISTLPPSPNPATETNPNTPITHPHFSGRRCLGVETQPFPTTFLTKTPKFLTNPEV